MLIYCDAGHGINTAGKRTPDGEREWSFNNKVVLAFMKQMKKYKGVKVVRADDPTGKRDVPLAERTNAANRANADFYISFHHNAYKSKWGDHGGVETYYYKGNNVGKAIAQAVQNTGVKVYGLRDRGIKTNNLHITRETKMTAVLFEGGFMDSTTDIDVIRDDKVLSKAGTEFAKTIASHFKLKQNSKPAPKPTPPKPKPVKPTKLKITGVLDKATITALQKYFNTTVDGYLSNPSLVIKALQRFLGTTVDGYISTPYSEMIAALQRRFGTKVDGYISKGYSQVIAELQRRLNKGKL